MNFDSFKKSYLTIFQQYSFFTIFISLSILQLWITDYNFTLNEAKKGIIGFATIEMVDVNARVSLFYKALFLFFMVLLIVGLLVKILKKHNVLPKNILLILNYLSAYGIFLFLLKFISSDNWVPVTFIQLSVSVLLLFFLLKQLTHFARKKIISKNELLFIAGISFSILSSLNFIVHIFDNSFVLKFYHNYFILSTLVLIIYLWKKRDIKNFKYILFFSKPIFTIPLLFFIGAEIYLILNQRNIHFIPTYGIYIFLLSLPISYFLFLKSKFKKNDPIHIKDQFNKFIFPILILTISLFIFYHPIIENFTDMFELANPANAMMRTIKFGEVPLLEAFSSHLLSEQLYGFLYIGLNGYNGSIDFTIYSFILQIIVVLVIYYFILKLSNNGIFAFSTVIFFPFFTIIFYPHLGIINDSYCLAIPSLFLIHRIIRYYSFYNLILVFAYSAFLLLWRIDLGLANGIAVAGILLLHLILNYNKSLLVDYLKATPITVISIAVIVVILSLLFQIPIIINGKQALDYIAGSQAHGYSTVARYYDKIFYLHHFVFPILVLLILLYTIFTVTKNKGVNYFKNFSHLSLLFFILFYLANAQRGLVRHGFMEETDVYLSSFIYLIAFLSIFIFCFKESKEKIYITLALTSLIISSYKFPLSNEQSYFSKLIPTFIEYKIIEDYYEKINRTQVSEDFKEKTYLELKKFMDDNFSPNSTFLDFSNTPMLYYYLQRPVPSYFNQYMQNTVTDYLQKENLNTLAKYDVPVVLFSHVPETWYDNTDNIPKST